MIPIAAITSHKRRDERNVLAVANTDGSILAGLDIFIASLSDQSSWAHCQREQEQREDDDV